MDLAEIVLIGIGVGLFALLLVAIALRRLPGSTSGIVSLTALHDFQPVDKQNATEIVVEQKAGKRWTEQEQGDADRREGDDRTDGAGLTVSTDPRGPQPPK